MSCYLRHMSGVLQEAGIKVTRENKKDIDKALHNLVNVEYKNCSPTWKEIKKLLQTEEGKKKIVKELKNLH
ncbi:MAG: hypothetical protein HXS46_04275 [Theionarchaea archaeon]|nr:hypothetical protein [Theionarchaea archaeon]